MKKLTVIIFLQLIFITSSLAGEKCKNLVDKPKKVIIRIIILSLVRKISESCKQLMQANINDDPSANLLIEIKKTGINGKIKKFIKSKIEALLLTKFKI